MITYTIYLTALLSVRLQGFEHSRRPGGELAAYLGAISLQALGLPSCSREWRREEAKHGEDRSIRASMKSRRTRSSTTAGGWTWPPSKSMTVAATRARAARRARVTWKHAEREGTSRCDDDHCRTAASYKASTAAVRKDGCQLVLQ